VSEKDVIYSKISIIKNCVSAIDRVKREEKDSFFRQGLYELNLQRAIQACIDLGHTVIAKEGFSLPNSYRQVFEILASEGVISRDLAKIMGAMVGFRNISVHDYGEIKAEIVDAIVAKHLPDLERFYETVYKRVNESWK
jgi:uncharacterized protein YutE (UPF0331/DUF86 family)